MSSSQTVLVTGASGLLGSHVVERLLQSGYSVRACARSTKVDVVKATYPHAGDRLEVIAIDDIITGDFTAALQDVFGVIHVASPVPNYGDAKVILDGAIHGTANVLQQAIQAGVKHLVLTSSHAALVNPKKGEKSAPALYTADDWNDATAEDVLAPGESMYHVYAASKASAERAAWKIVDQNPDVDLTVLILPPLFGPFVQGWTVKPGASSTLSSMELAYSFLNGVDAPFDMKRVLPMYLPAAAQAHVDALRAPPASQVGPKRFLLAGEYFTWAELAEHLREVRPALTDRLPKYDSPKEWGKKAPLASSYDSKRAQDLLGIAKVPEWTEVMVEAVDAILNLEGEWEKQGWWRRKL